MGILYIHFVEEPVCIENNKKLGLKLKPLVAFPVIR